MTAQTRRHPLAAAFVLGAASIACAAPGGIRAETTQQLDVPYVPTPDETVERMLAMANVGRDDFVIDLGSGDGRILIAAAKRYGARGFGVDLDEDRVAESRENAAKENVADKVEFHNQDLFDTDISQANVLTMYLLPKVNLKLRPRILSELRPGTRVVSHDFSMGDWEPDASSLGPRGNNQVYLWIVPARVQGRWEAQLELPGGAEDYTIELRQRYQQLSGLVTPRQPAAGNPDRTPLPVQGARMHGKDIAFTVVDPNGGDPVQYKVTGRVEGDSMTGRVQGEGRNAPAATAWRAKRVGE